MIEVKSRRRTRLAPFRTGNPDPAFVNVARLLKVVSDAHRLRLLDELGEGELTVTEVSERLGLPFHHTSAQLRALWAERLVQRRRAGSNVLYRRANNLGREVVDLVLAWVHRSSRKS